jgi:aspartate-semialdehyde dehydrogenase
MQDSFNNKKNIAIVGATGLVGQELLKLLEHSKININILKCFASKKSLGKIINFKDKKIKTEIVKEKCFDDIDIAFFCAGSKISKEIIHLTKNEKTIVIDLSSAFRMEQDIPLIIPEINSHTINQHRGIIASPNCTTTIMLMPIHHLHKKYKIKRIVASTYQAASGGGIKLMKKLENDTKEFINNRDFESNDPYHYGFNVFLHESALHENKYSEEELKMIYETRKILEDDSIQVTATCVRVPVMRTHSISLNIEFEKNYNFAEAYEIIKKSSNVNIIDDFQKNQFATPKTATNKATTFCSRIRQDLSKKNSLEMWIVGDQLLKGAALNALQIAEKLL